MIADPKGNDALKDGMFGYLSAMKVGSKTVALYKTELHHSWLRASVLARDV